LVTLGSRIPQLPLLFAKQSKADESSSYVQSQSEFCASGSIIPIGKVKIG